MSAPATNAVSSTAGLKPGGAASAAAKSTLTSLLNTIAASGKMGAGSVLNQGFATAPGWPTALGGTGSPADMVRANAYQATGSPLALGGTGSAADMAQANQQGLPASYTNPQGTPSQLQALLTQLAGAAPTAPTAADFGPAPTLADFFTSTPYDQAKQALVSGGQTAQNTINQAFAAGAAAQAKANAQGQASTQLMLNEANQAASGAQNAVNGFARDASAGAGAGGAVQARLAAMQGLSAQQTGDAQALNHQLAGIQNNNMAQDASMAATSKQNALNFLASQLSGARNNINLQEANDQAKAQQMLAAANASYGQAQAAAQKDYQASQQSYQAHLDSLLQSATSAASQGSETYAQQADDQLAQWQQAASNGDKNAGSLYQVVNGALYGGKNSQGQSIPGAKNAAQALQMLNQMAPAIGGAGSPAYIQAEQVIRNHFSSGKAQVTTNDIMNALKQMLALSGQ